MKFGKFLFVGTLVAASALYAAEATDPTVKARQELMDMIAMNTKVLGDMAGGKAPHDAAAAEAAKAALVTASATIGARFETEASDPKSMAKPDIWTNWEDFLKKAGVLNAAATAMDVASAETIGAGMGALGGACADCHKTYQIPR